MRCTTPLPLFVLSFAVCRLVAADAVTPIEFPGATQTMAHAINAGGDVVGYYHKDGTHGFIWSHGRFQTIDVPGAEGWTWAYGINDRGDIVGCSGNLHGRCHGFLLRDGQFTTIDIPGAAGTYLTGINTRGEICGYIVDAVTRDFRGVILDGRGGYQIIDGPGARLTTLVAIGPNGEALGRYSVQTGQNWTGYSFLWRNGAFNVIDIPNATFQPSGLNARGQLVGTIQRSPETIWHGVILEWTPEAGEKSARYVDFAELTTLNGINARGCVVGYYLATPTAFPSFLTCPPRN